MLSGVCVDFERKFLEHWHELPTKHIYLLDLLRLHTPVFTICKVEGMSMLIFLFLRIILGFCQPTLNIFYC